MSVIQQQKLLSCVCLEIPGKDMACTDMAASVAASLTPRKRRVLPRALRDNNAKLPLKRVAESPKKLAGKDKTNPKRSRGSSH